MDDLHDRRPDHRVEGRNRTKADLLFYRVEDRRIALKTYAPRGTLIRNTIGRWLTRREVAAYEAADGVAGLPGFLGRAGPFSLATVWVEAIPLRECPEGRVPDSLFDELSDLLDRLHGRGVALGDLHHRDVLVGREGELWVVDLATALVLGPRPGPFRRRLFARLCEADRLNLARMRARFTGRDVGRAIESVSPAAAAWHRRGRRLKQMLDRLRGRRSH